MSFCALRTLTLLRAAYLDISGFWFYHIDYAPILVSFLTEFDDCLPIFQQYLESYGLVSYLDNLDQVVASRLGMNFEVAHSDF